MSHTMFDKDRESAHAKHRLEADMGVKFVGSFFYSILRGTLFIHFVWRNRRKMHILGPRNVEKFGLYLLLPVFFYLVLYELRNEEIRRRTMEIFIYKEKKMILHRRLQLCAPGSWGIFFKKENKSKRVELWLKKLIKNGWSAVQIYKQLQQVPRFYPTINSAPEHIYTSSKTKTKTKFFFADYSSYADILIPHCCVSRKFILDQCRALTIHFFMRVCTVSALAECVTNLRSS